MSRATLVYVLALWTVLLGFPTAAHAQAFGGMNHRLRAKHSGKCLDVAWFSFDDGGDVVQSTCTGTDNQKWKIYWGSINSPMILVAKHTSIPGSWGKALDVLNQSTSHAADVVQWAYGGFFGPTVRTSQWWDRLYVKTENGIHYYALVNRRSGRCLDVAWFDQSDGGNVLQANCTLTDNQLWEITSLGTY